MPLSASRFDWESMSATPFEPDRETVLFDITCAHDPEPPSPTEVDAWCSRFPQHVRAIRADVAAWVRRDIASNRVPLHYRDAARSR